MERCNELQLGQKVKKICNRDELDRSEGYYKQLNKFEI